MTRLSHYNIGEIYLERKTEPAITLRVCLENVGDTLFAYLALEIAGVVEFGEDGSFLGG